MDIELLGMFFNEVSIESDEEPQKKLVINKYNLDRSSKNIIGRFKYEINSRTKLIFNVSVDGVMVNEYGTNLPYETNAGNYDTVLFRYPNSAKANKDGLHKVHVEFGMIPNIVESSYKVVWDDVVAPGEADFEIELTPDTKSGE